MKKITALYLLVILAIMITGCSSPSSPQTDQDAINGVLNTMQAGMQSENSEQVVALFTDPFDSNGVPMSKAGYSFILELSFALSDFEYYHIINRTINITGSTATVACTVQVKTVGGTEQNNPGTFSFIKSGGWKISGVSESI